MLMARSINKSYDFLLSICPAESAFQTDVPAIISLYAATKDKRCDQKKNRDTWFWFFIFRYFICTEFELFSHFAINTYINKISTAD